MKQSVRVGHVANGMVAEVWGCVGHHVYFPVPQDSDVPRSNTAA